MDKVWYEFSFVIDHECFSGEISCSIAQEKVLTEEEYQNMLTKVTEDFLSRFTILESDNNKMVT